MTDAAKLKLPVLVVAGLLSAAATAAGTWTAANAHLEETRARVERLEHHQEATNREAETQRLRTQRVEDALATVADMVKEIRQDVKDLKRR